MDIILSGANIIVGIIPVIIGINSLLKKIGLKGRFSPLVNLILGFMALPLLLNDFGLYEAIIACLIIGLSAGGFYDLGKRTILDK